MRTSRKTVNFCCNRGTFKPQEAAADWARQNAKGMKMDASVLIGAPLGLGILLALGGLMVVMTYLSQ
jgi:hypothetical protein